MYMLLFILSLVHVERPLECGPGTFEDGTAPFFGLYAQTDTRYCYPIPK